MTNSLTTPTLLDPDGFGAGVLAAAAAELIGPLSSSATPRPLGLRPVEPTDPKGIAEAVVDTTSRYPLVMCAVRTDVTDQLMVLPELRIGTGPSKTLPALSFERYTVAGTALVAAVLPVDEDGVSGPFTLRAHGLLGESPGIALSAAELAATVRFDLVQGVLGRLLAVLLDEKGRLRRTARQIRAMRTLSAASGDALDRIGAELACPRFADELFWDAERRSPGTRPLADPTAREDDASYRARLRVLRGVRLPSPPWLESVLNGTGAPDDPGTGLLADVGVTSRVSVDESVEPRLLSMRLVAPGRDGTIATLLDAIRRVHLIWPAGSTEGDVSHAARLLPPDVVAQVNVQRAALATWQLQPFQPVAPALAEALTRLDALCDRLGARPWPRVLTGQSNDGGSRFELGLGALLAAPVAAQLDAAVEAATALGDPDLVPAPRSADPAGAWLLTATGLRTTEQAADGTVFVSTVPMGPLVVDADPDAEAVVPFTLRARLLSVTDPDHDVPVVAVIQAFAPSGLSPVADQDAVLAGARPVTAVPGLTDALDSRGVPAVTDVAEFVHQLGLLSARDYAIFDLGPARTASAIATPTELSPLFATARAAGAASVVGLATGAGTLALVFGAVGLPLAGSNLAGERTLIHRWQVRALGDTQATLHTRRGAIVTVSVAGSGVSLVSCLVSRHSGTGANDPFEWRPTLSDGVLLTLRQYEHLLNIVEVATPAGVRADTVAIRTRHVDVDGSGSATPLTIAAARAYRHYRVARSARAGQGDRTHE